ncbi:thiamine phosphate synthase [Pinisolibacter sp.]|uniref:thiamine phosphate synthase n=1 Tax=Pinisolibacter sp. TaxID=2172024 RepID=UPI002FDC8909
MRADIRLHAILDPTRTRGRALADMARAAVEGGATILQYRDKDAPTWTMMARAREILAALEGSTVPLIVNDRVDVALAAAAHGVHVGQEDMHPEDARRLLGPAAIIGQTVKSAAHAAAVPLDAVDYVCIGGVFATTSKDNPDPPVGLDGLAGLVAAMRARRADLPVGAIAGITVENTPTVIQAGADGVAVISEIFMADDPAAAARALRAAVDAALSARNEETRR